MSTMIGHIEAEILRLPTWVEGDSYAAQADMRHRAALVGSRADAVIDAATALLHKLDHMTTAEFACGGEREEREALRKMLAGITTAAPERRTATPVERH